MEIENFNCAICLECSLDESVFIGECRHAFHFNCILKARGAGLAWQCPMCRAEWKSDPKKKETKLRADRIISTCSLTYWDIILFWCLLIFWFTCNYEPIIKTGFFRVLAKENDTIIRIPMFILEIKIYRLLKYEVVFVGTVYFVTLQLFIQFLIYALKKILETYTKV